jgi:hypothetical protein
MAEPDRPPGQRSLFDFVSGEGEVVVVDRWWWWW